MSAILPTIGGVGGFAQQSAGCTQMNLSGTRIFSPRAVPGLSVTIGRYWYLFKRLTPVRAGRIYRLEPIETNSSGKVVAK